MNLEPKDINTLGIQLQEIKYHFSCTNPKGRQPHHFLQLNFEVKYFLKQAFWRLEARSSSGGMVVVQMGAFHEYGD